MAAMRGPRLRIGSAAWVAEERSSASQITESEVEEFSYSARNELDWLNEHMAAIFNENETNIAETFKTPGRLRGKTPHTIRKGKLPETRVPLSDVFGGTPNGSALRPVQKVGKMQTPPRLQPVTSKLPSSPTKSTSPVHHDSSPKRIMQQGMQDSGYHGSQDIDAMEVDFVQNNAHDTEPETEKVIRHETRVTPVAQSPEQTHRVESVPQENSPFILEDQNAHTSPAPEDAREPHGEEQEKMQEEFKSTPSSPVLPRSDGSVLQPQTQGQFDKDVEPLSEEPEEEVDDAMSDDANSASDGSSPIRPMVRKSSLNFASLPAREPMTSGKSIGGRVSRISHLESNRTSYYSRPTGGKSLGNHARHASSDEVDAESENDQAPNVDDAPGTEDLAMTHNKTYTQRLQDQINMLGKSQPSGGRPSKSIPNQSSTQLPAANLQSVQPSHQFEEQASSRTQELMTTPGGFPEDDEDDWIDPPASVLGEFNASTPRPALAKSYSTDVMERLYSTKTIGGADFAAVTTQKPAKSKAQEKDDEINDKPYTSQAHNDNAPVSVLPIASNEEYEGVPLQKAATVPNSTLGMTSIFESQPVEASSHSPTRQVRDGPFKSVKNKLSSILKSSKGLLGSTTAASAVDKAAPLSPAVLKSPSHAKSSFELAPPISKSDRERSDEGFVHVSEDGSPSRPIARRTRASIENEEKRREKEAKHMVDQMDKLEKAREQEREKARVFTKEQGKLTAMEKQVVTKKENERPMIKETPKPSRTSLRRIKGALEGEGKPSEQDVEMADAPSAIPPPTVSRSVGPARKELKRPVKPRKESQVRPKQAPTVIRVNTGSQHSQYHPSTSTASASVQDNFSSAPQPQTASKASKASLQPKPSLQSLKSSVSSNGRPKALEIAAKKKEQDERDAQRRREAKAEIERKRAAAQEEQRKQEYQRRAEAERQRQKERELAASQAEAKKNAQRQAAIEKAKQTRAPPPAVRSQPNGPPDFRLAGEKMGYSSSSQRADGPSSRPPSRLTSTIPRPHEESNRPVNTLLSTASKPLAKRPLGHDVSDDGQVRVPPSRGGPAYQAKDAKRRRTSDEFLDELDVDTAPKIKGPPVRPSAGFKKDLPTKSLFQNGYTNAPQSVTRDLFKATVTSQHAGSSKAAHPLDMAQISKGGIPFAPNPNPARPGAAHPMKSAVKSAPRSSPRFQNGDSIELPEIQTDDEDSDDDDAHGGAIAAWADSPDLRRALAMQETMDPSQIFGPPAPLNMEEVFNKSKDKWHKFRARTSSANWSGTDRLTEDDIRKDMAARDKMRREGGWSYEMSKDMA